MTQVLRSLGLRSWLLSCATGRRVPSAACFGANRPRSSRGVVSTTSATSSPRRFNLGYFTFVYRIPNVLIVGHKPVRPFRFVEIRNHRMIARRGVVVLSAVSSRSAELLKP